MDMLAPGVAALGTTAAALLVRYGAQRWLDWRTVWARPAADGVQEATIVVRSGYQPSTVRVRAGYPVRLVFQRDEDDPCTSSVYLAEPPLTRRLTPFAATVVTFTPRRIGDHLFTCEEGRFRGHLIVEPPLPPRGHENGRATMDSGSIFALVSCLLQRLRGRVERSGRLHGPATGAERHRHQLVRSPPDRRADCIRRILAAPTGDGLGTRRR